MFDFEKTEQSRQQLSAPPPSGFSNNLQYGSLQQGGGAPPPPAHSSMLMAPPPAGGQQYQNQNHHQNNNNKAEKYPLFVGNIEGTVDLASFRALFEPFGSVIEARLHGTTDQIYRYGFVEFGNPADRERAKEEMNNFWLKGRPILCNIGKGASDAGGAQGGARRGRDSDGSGLVGSSGGNQSIKKPGDDDTYDPYRADNSGKSKRGAEYKPMIGFGGQLRHNYILLPVHSMPFPVPKHPFVIQLDPTPKIKYSNEPPTPELYTIHELRLREYRRKAEGLRNNYLESLKQATEEMKKLEEVDEDDYNNNKNSDSDSNSDSDDSDSDSSSSGSSSSGSSSSSSGSSSDDDSDDSSK